jgi:hypothetical protein
MGFSVPETDDPNEADFEQASSRLNEGLKICRTLVAGYRALLTTEKKAGAAGNKEVGLDKGEKAAAND